MEAVSLPLFPKTAGWVRARLPPAASAGPDNSNSIPRVPVHHNGAQEASPSPSDDTTLSPAPRPPCLPGPHPSCTERAKGSWPALQPPQRQKKQKQKREERACLSIGEREFSTEIRSRPPTGPSVHGRPGLDKRERGVWPPGVPVATVYNAEAQRIPQADPARVSEGTRAPPTPVGQ